MKPQNVSNITHFIIRLYFFPKFQPKSKHLTEKKRKYMSAYLVKIYEIKIKFTLSDFCCTKNTLHTKINGAIKIKNLIFAQLQDLENVIN